MQVPQQLPPDINAEVLMNYYRLGDLKVSLHGLHKRNTYRDVIALEEAQGDVDALHLTLGRMSIYNSLPEFMFHPVDRFDNLSQNDGGDAFYDEVKQEEKEREEAFRFFLPIDVMLFHLRADIRRQIDKYTQGDRVMQQIIGDRLTEEQRGNRFVRQFIPLLPQCKNIRGNRTLLSLLLRKVLLEEGLRIDIHSQRQKLHDDSPRYGDSVGMTLGDSYVGNEWSEDVTVYTITYWPEEDSGEAAFRKFLDEVEVLREFIADYFLPVETTLVFDVHQAQQPVWLGDENSAAYLNYNINL